MYASAKGHSRHQEHEDEDERRPYRGKSDEVIQPVHIIHRTAVDDLDAVVPVTRDVHDVEVSKQLDEPAQDTQDTGRKATHQFDARGALSHGNLPDARGWQTDTAEGRTGCPAT